MPRFLKGQSGNPAGRPPKSRTLTAILAARADDLSILAEDAALTNKEVVAQLLWRFVTSGEVEIGGRTLRAEDINDWVNAVRWLYSHIDGPAQTDPNDNDLIIKIERVSVIDGNQH